MELAVHHRLETLQKVRLFRQTVDEQTVVKSLQLVCVCVGGPVDCDHLRGGEPLLATITLPAVTELLFKGANSTFREKPEGSFCV